MIKKLDKRAEKEEKKTPNSTARTALKRRVDSTPLSGPPKDAPVWAVAGPSSINGTPSAGISGESQVTPEAHPGITANPRRLVGEAAFQDLYGNPHSPLSSSDSDTD